MLNKRVSPWFLGSIAMILFLLAMFGSSSFQECASNCTYASEDQQNSSSSLLFSVVRNVLRWTRLICAGNFIHDTHEEILAAFTVLLAIFTLALWASTSKIAEDAKRASERQLRAYIGPDVVTIDWTHRRRPLAGVSIKNFGHTPAHEVVSYIGIAIVDYPLPASNSSDTYVYPEAPPSKCSLWPGQSHSNIDSLKSEIGHAEETQLGSSSKVIMIFGQITYTDIFGGRQKTIYRYVWGKAVGAEDSVCAACHEGNEAT